MKNRVFRITAITMILAVVLSFMPQLYRSYDAGAAGNASVQASFDSFESYAKNKDALFNPGYNGYWCSPDWGYDRAWVRITKCKKGQFKGKFWMYHRLFLDETNGNGKVDIIGTASFSKKIGGKKKCTFTVKVDGVKVKVTVWLKKVKTYSKNDLYYQGVKFKYTFKSKYDKKTQTFTTNALRKKPVDEQ